MISTTLISCSTGPDVIFVREDLDVDGEPRAILKIIESTETTAAYYNGSEWVVTDGVTLPAGWLVVSPKLGPKRKEKEGED